mmetsp:Transcript_14180/g.19763  ORF Transcript_14180/g.19763 Transcript_14180/m.19763 type:complete len:185 (+) Transcript_14180:22-576(+)
MTMDVSTIVLIIIITIFTVLGIILCVITRPGPGESIIQNLCDYAFDGEVQKVKQTLEELREFAKKETKDGPKEQIDALMRKLLDKQNRHGLTALHYASERGHDEIVELLLKAGCDVNVQDNEGQTALHWASTMSQKRTIELLLAHNADPLIQDGEGEVAFDFAVEDDVAELLNNAMKVRAPVPY